MTKTLISNEQLLWALEGGNPAEIKDLIKSGANVNYQIYFSPGAALGYSPLMTAIYRGYPTIAINLLLEAGADINLQNPHSGCTALHIAVERDCLKGVKFLISKGANPYIKHCRQMTPLECAKEYLKEKGRGEHIIELLEEYQKQYKEEKII